MPEIAEVHRVVHYLRRHLINRKIRMIHAQDDEIVFGKVGCSAKQFKESLVGKSVVDVKQQGKYFWIVMSSPPHPLMHLGMTGWIEFSNDDNAHYRPKTKDAEWPPRFCKFRLEMEGKPDCEVAFVDARRLARIRLVNVAAEEMRKTTPLKENGPDPVVDQDRFTKDWLKEKLQKKRVPVKAFLLNQANISGIGNWVADEVLYQARIHPEQYSNTFSDKEMDRIHNSIMTVCMTACDVLADSSKFPDDWLMRYRWGKGKSKENTLPNGHKITFITVGGRTSAVVASLQKKTGPVSDNAKVEEDDGASLLQSKKIPKLKTKAKKTIATKVVDDSSQSRRKSTRKVAPKAYTQEEIDSPVEQIVPERTAKRKMAASDESRSGFKRARK